MVDMNYQTIRLVALFYSSCFNCYPWSAWMCSCVFVCNVGILLLIFFSFWWCLMPMLFMPF